MTSLALLLYTDPEVIHSLGLWVFLSIGAISLFGIFIPTVTWIDKQHKERVAESTGEGAKAALELLQQQSRQEQLKKREGMKIGGLVCVGVGMAMVIFMRAMTAADPGAPYLIGLIPGFIGVALLVYVFFLAAPVE